MKLFTAFLISGLALPFAAELTAQAAPAACPTPAASQAKPWLDPSYTPQCRAQFVLKQLKTLDDKLAFLASNRFGPPGANQRNVMAELGLVRGGGSDGPAGIRRVRGATAFPTPLTVGASFDPAIAARFGNLLGQEFFAAGLNGVTGPAMDMARTWHFGRATESFGEDPFLTASMVGPEVAAIQSHHVIATIKHFAVYTQEEGRSGFKPLGLKPAVNEEVSERALREIYLPSFHAAVTKGGAGSVMCSFPRINGVYACQNSHTLGILKKEWGFDGQVGPDFPDAQRTIVPAILAGLDRGALAPLPGPPTADRPMFTGQKSLREAAEDGQVPMSRIDDLVLRNLVPGFRIGVFDHPAKRVSGEVSTPETRAALVNVITSGAVLLKDENGILPLGPNVKSIALIGEQAGNNPIVVEQGSPYVTPLHIAPILAAVQSRAGQKVKVSYAQGTLGLEPLPVVPAAMLKTPEGKPGVKMEYFASPKLDFSGKPLATRSEPTIALDKAPAIAGLPANMQWSARFTTMFTPNRTGIQKFTLNGSSDGRLLIGGKLIGEFLRSDMGSRIYANVPMTAGRPVEIQVEFSPRETFGEQKTPEMGTVFGPTIALGWAPPDDLIEKAAEAAKHADVAVVCVSAILGEGMDRRSLSLPGDQNALIEAVAKANPRTVVILDVGGAVTMPWLNQVAGVLDMWLPGDSIGPATAKLLFGDAGPGGRLPITFPADQTQGPGTKPSEYPGTVAADGSLDTAHFDEGIFIGYRYWDQYNQKPLFPFGYGLSYTTFAMKGLGAKASRDGGAAVDVAVKNTGKRAGSDVVEVYLGFPKSAGEPPKQLKAFQKIMLEPGQEKTAHLTLDANAFKYWNQGSHGWTTAPGVYTVMVGRSSRDILWSGAVTPAAH